MYIYIYIYIVSEILQGESPRGKAESMAPPNTSITSQRPNNLIDQYQRSKNNLEDSSEIVSSSNRPSTTQTPQLSLHPYRMMTNLGGQGTGKKLLSGDMLGSRGGMSKGLINNQKIFGWNNNNNNNNNKSSENEISGEQKLNQIVCRIPKKNIFPKPRIRFPNISPLREKALHKHPPSVSFQSPTAMSNPPQQHMNFTRNALHITVNNNINNNIINNEIPVKSILKIGGSRGSTANCKGKHRLHFDEGIPVANPQHNSFRIMGGETNMINNGNNMNSHINNTNYFSIYNPNQVDLVLNINNNNNMGTGHLRRGSNNDNRFVVGGQGAFQDLSTKLRAFNQSGGGKSRDLNSRSAVTHMPSTNTAKRFSYGAVKPKKRFTIKDLC